MAAHRQDPPSAGGLQPGVFGPTVAHGRPRDGGPDWGRLAVLLVGVVTSMAVLVAGGYGALLLVELRQFQSNQVDLGDAGVAEQPVDTGGEDGGEADDAPVDAVQERTTILLVGSDSREGLTDEQLARIGTEDDGSNLTDTLILLQIDPSRDVAAMLSFPRDLVVERCDGTRGRINKAYFIGEEQQEGTGARCLVETITRTTGIEVDHYVRVNFAGFVEAVDAIGGVEFYVQEPLQDAYSGIDIPEAGCVAFDGVKALQFVRARRVDNDFGRMARQQRFAREIVDKSTSLGTLANPARVASLITSVSEVLETDTRFGVSQMVDLVTSVRNISSGAVDARTVPGYSGTLGPASVVYALEDEAEALYRAFRTGDLLPEGVGTDAAPKALTADNVIPVDVQNGSGQDGLGSRTAAVLEELGFTVGEVGTADNYGFAASLVLHPAERADHAAVLAEALGGLAVNTGSPDADTLTLILGDSFDPEAFAPEGMPEPGASEDATEEPSDAPPSEGEDASQDEFAGADLSDVRC